MAQLGFNNIQVIETIEPIYLILIWIPIWVAPCHSVQHTLPAALVESPWSFKHTVDRQLHSSSGRNRDHMRASKAVALSSGTSRSEPFSVRRWIWQPWSKTWLDWLDNLYGTTRTSSNPGQRDCLFVFLQIQKTSNVYIVSAKDVWKSKSWNTQTS